MKISKRSQISAQVFIYVIAIILFSLILVYGYNAIRGFKEKSEQISYIKFRTDLVSTVDRISSDYGTVKMEEFFIGGNYNKVCFVQNFEADKNSILLAIDAVGDKIVYDSVKSDVDKNVFLFTQGFQESFDVGTIKVSGGYLCVDVINGKIKVRFEGEGDHTLISN